MKRNVKSKRFLIIFATMLVIMLTVLILPSLSASAEEAAVEEYATGWIPDDGSIPASFSNGSTRTINQLADLPTSVDLSVNDAFPVIGNQGNYGSCAAYATTYYQFTYQVSRLNNVNAKSSYDNVFSPIQLFNYLNSGNVYGGSSILGYYYFLSEIGAVRYSEFNTTAASLCAWNGKSKWFEISYDDAWYSSRELTVLALERALKTRVSAWNSEKFSLQNKDTNVPIITPSDMSCLDSIKNLIATDHLVVFGLSDAYSIQYDLQRDENNTAYVSCFEAIIDNNGHALTIVGYDDNKYFDLNSNGVVEAFEYGAFKVANSWGATWGSSGFFWMPYDTLNMTSNDSSLNASDRIVPLYENEFYFMEVQNYNPELTVEVELNLKSRIECELGLERLVTSVGAEVNTFMNGLHHLTATETDGVFTYALTTDFNGNIAGYAAYDSRVFVFDLSNQYYNNAYFSTPCEFYDTNSSYNLAITDSGASNTYATTVESIVWKDGLGNILFADSPVDVLDGSAEDYYYGGYVLDTSTVVMNQDARRVHFQVTASNLVSRIQVHIGSRSYVVARPGTTPTVTTINGDQLKVSKVPINTDTGPKYVWDFQIKLSQPTPAGTTENFYVEYRKGTEYIPGRVYTDFVAYGSYVKTGLNEGMMLEDVIDDINENDIGFTYSVVNGLTFDDISYTSTTKAGTGMIILKKYNGKIAEVYFLVLFGDISGGGTIGDGLILVDDALAATRHIAETGLITEEFFLIAADVDHDGDIDQSDSQAILNHVAQASTLDQSYMITEIPNGLYYVNEVEFV